MWGRRVGTARYIRDLALRNANRLSFCRVSNATVVTRHFSSTEGSSDEYEILFQLSHHQVRSMAKALGFQAVGSREDIAGRLKIHFRECQLPLPENLQEMFPVEWNDRLRSPDWPKLKELLLSAKEAEASELEMYNVKSLKRLCLKLGIKKGGEQALITRLRVYFEEHDQYDISELHSDGPNSGRSRLQRAFGRQAFPMSGLKSPAALDTPDDKLHLMRPHNLNKLAKHLKVRPNSEADILIPQIVQARKQAVAENEEIRAFNQKEKHKMQPRISAFKKFIHTKHLREPIVSPEGQYTVEKVLDTIAHLKERGTIPKSYILRMINDATDLLRPLPNVLTLSRPVVHKEAAAAEGGGGAAGVGTLTVVGDTLGDLDNLLHIMSASVAGLPSFSNSFLFTGNMINGGSNSFEALTTLLLLKLMNPSSIHLLRGLQETTLMNSRGSFQSQILRLYDTEVLAEFRRLFCALPIAAVVEKKVFVVHGGIGKQTANSSIAELNVFARNGEPATSGPLTELLWANPKDGVDGFIPNKTKGGFYYGQTAARRFLNRNDLDLIVQSQDFISDGYDQHHNGRCITLFSAPHIIPHGSNVGGLLRFNAEYPTTPQFLQFEKASNVKTNGSLAATAEPPRAYRSSGLRGTLRGNASRV